MTAIDREAVRALVAKARASAAYYRDWREMDTPEEFDALADALESLLALVPEPAEDEREALIAEVRELFDEGWCVCTRSGLGDRVLDALEASRPSPATVEAVEGFIAGFECDWRDVVPGELAAALVARFAFPAPVVTKEMVEQREQLRELPIGTVIEDAFAAICVKERAVTVMTDWHRSTVAVKGGSHQHPPYLPGRVLYRPAAVTPEAGQ
jgi:hypothetical protein